MAVAAQGALLDKLMGVNRNGDKQDAVIADFRDARVCRNFLLGLCPHELFAGAKEESATTGACPQAHDDRLKRAYEEAARSTDFGYERDMERALERLIADVEHKISKGRDRVREEGGGDASGGFIPRVEVDSTPELVELTNKIEDMEAEADDLTARGEYEKAGRISEHLETIRRKKAETQARVLIAKTTDEERRAPAGSNKQRLRVCDVCGAFLSLHDSEERIADHFGGRVHLGYVAIRTKLRNIRDWRRAVRAMATGGAAAADKSLGAYAAELGSEGLATAAAAAAAAAFASGGAGASSSATSSSSSSSSSAGGGTGTSSNSMPLGGGGGGGGGGDRDRDRGSDRYYGDRDRYGGPAASGDRDRYDRDRYGGGGGGGGGGGDYRRDDRYGGRTDDRDRYGGGGSRYGGGGGGGYGGGGGGYGGGRDDRYGGGGGGGGYRRY